MKKIKIKALGNDDRYNHISIEKSEVFLDNLQQFVVDSGFVSLRELEKSSYEDEQGRPMDVKTYHTIFQCDHEDKEPVRRKIKDIKDGVILRYSSKDKELLIISFVKRIELVFYCNQSQRKNVISALLNFSEFEETFPKKNA